MDESVFAIEVHAKRTVIAQLTRLEFTSLCCTVHGCASATLDQGAIVLHATNHMHGLLDNLANRISGFNQNKHELVSCKMNFH